MPTKNSRHPSTLLAKCSAGSSERRLADARRHPRIPPTRHFLGTRSVELEGFTKQPPALQKLLVSSTAILGCGLVCLLAARSGGEMKRRCRSGRKTLRVSVRRHFPESTVAEVSAAGFLRSEPGRILGPWPLSADSPVPGSGVFVQTAQPLDRSRLGRELTGGGSAPQDSVPSL